MLYQFLQHNRVNQLYVYITRWSTPKSDCSIQSAKTRPGADCGSDHDLLNAKFRLKLKKLGKTTRPFSSVAQSCPTLCDPINLSMPGLQSVMPSSYLILLSSPSPPALNLSQHQGLFKWVSSPKYWSFSFNINPSNEHPGLISFRMDWWISLQSKGLSRVFSNTKVQKHQFFSTQFSLQSNSHIHT